MATNTSGPNSELKSSLDFTKTKIHYFSGRLVQTLGSIGFLLVCMVVFTGWIFWNINLFPHLKPFDPFPFPILEMTVSLFAIILSVSVLINQNRQGQIETIRQQVEFEVNVRAEEEITKLLSMMHELHQRLGINSEADKELEKMKEATDIQEIHQAIGDKLTGEAKFDSAG